MKNKNKNQKNAELKLHIKAFLLLIAFLLVGCSATEIEQGQQSVDVIATTTPAETFDLYEVKSESIREVSAYNVGDEAQTDDTPCIGAYSNLNLCQKLEEGGCIFATNAFPKGTLLRIKSLVSDWEMTCEVWDRMNSRYTNRIDVAMRLDEKTRALKFGVQKLLVQELIKK